MYEQGRTMMNGSKNNSNVISLAPKREAMFFPSVARVRGYWEGLRNGRLMPTRDEIDPRGISDVLEFAFVLEKIAPGVARLRLAGMHLNDLMGMEVRGMPVTAMFLPEARRDLQEALETVLEAPAAVTLTLESDFGLTRPKLEAQMVLLPVKDSDGRVNRILGTLQAKGTIGRGPRRFRVLDQKIEPILSDRPAFTAPEHVRPAPADPSARPVATHAKPRFLQLVHDADAPR